MPLADLPYVYCTEEDIRALLSVEGETGRLDDDEDGSVSVTEGGYLTKAIQWATARLNLFLAPYYDQADLATDHVVNQWCVILACHWLSIRRGNPAPGSFTDQYKEVLEDLKLLRAGTINLDLGQRDVMWPAWSNVRVDQRYSLRKARVQRPLSDRSPPLGYVPNRDVGADYIVEPN